MVGIRCGIHALLVAGAGVFAALAAGGCTPEPLLPEQEESPRAWTLVNPRPFDMHIQDVWGVSPSRMFAGGAYGALLVRDGEGWRRAPSFTASNIYDLHGCDWEHVYAVCDEGLFRFDGERWTREPPGGLDLNARVWCNAPDDVMVVTAAGLSHHWDGTTWTEAPLDVTPAASPSDWLGGSPDGRYMVGGRDGRHAFWVGGAWQVEPDVPKDSIEAVLYAPDEFGGTWLIALEHWGNEEVRILVRNRQTWSEQDFYAGGLFVGMAPSGLAYHPYVLTSPWATNRVDIRRSEPAPRFSVHGVSSAALAVFPAGGDADGDELVVGAPFGTILEGRADADALAARTMSLAFSALGCTVWPSGDFAAFDYQSVVQGRGGDLSREFLSVPDRLTAVWGPAPGTLYAVGTHGLAALLRDGEPTQYLEGLPAAHYFCVWGRGPDDVWIGGDTTVHWDGATWTETPWNLLGSVLWIRGDASGEVYAASNDELARWDGEAWMPFGSVFVGSYAGLDVAPDSGDLYAVARPRNSESRHLLRLHQGTWEDCGAPGSNADDIVAMPGDVVYVATFGALRRWERGDWTSVPYPVETSDAHPWSTLAGDAEGGIYAGFVTGGFYHLDLGGKNLWR